MILHRGRLIRFELLVLFVVIVGRNRVVAQSARDRVVGVCYSNLASRFFWDQAILMAKVAAPSKGPICGILLECS